MAVRPGLFYCGGRCASRVLKHTRPLPQRDSFSPVAPEISLLLRCQGRRCRYRARCRLLVVGGRVVVVAVVAGEAAACAGTITDLTTGFWPGFFIWLSLKRPRSTGIVHNPLLDKPIRALDYGAAALARIQRPAVTVRTYSAAPSMSYQRYGWNRPIDRLRMTLIKAAM